MQKELFLIIFSLFIFFTSCKKDKENYLGPEYVVAGPNFKIVNGFHIARPVVNFRQNEVQSFETSFSERVSWTISLKGLSSGATATVSGLSDNIDAGNSFWSGKPSAYIMFDSEKVVASLSVLGSEVVVRDTFKIAAVPVNPEAAKLGDGFEDFSLNNPKYGWGPYPEPGELSTQYIDRDIHINGKASFHFQGEDLDKSYYMGVLRRSYLNNTLTSSAEDIYINVFAYGTGVPNTKLKIAAKEDENGNNSYQDVDKEDSWEYEIPIDFKGWKLITVRYSDLKLSTDKAHGGAGNGVKEPSKMAAIDFALFTSLPGSKAEVYLDYPIVTEGEAYKP